jgi:hypothetical protein
MVHQWNDINRDEMKLLPFLPLQGLHQKPDNKSSYFQEENTGNVITLKVKKSYAVTHSF